MNKHVVTADPESGTISHKIVYDDPPTEIMDRRRIATIGETYLRNWAEARKNLLRIDPKAVKISLEERMLHSKQPSLLSMTAVWPSTHDRSYLKEMRKLSEEVQAAHQGA